MKKIMFNDYYGLTRAVIEGRKTMTRRIITDSNLDARLEELWMDDKVNGSDWKFLLEHVAKYKIGEQIAVAQRYKDIADSIFVKEQLAANEENPQALRLSAGWNNKMFTVAYYMPHRIEIKARRFERLQDISERECLLEGIITDDVLYYCQGEGIDPHTDAVSAFADLIDGVNGTPIWWKNPWVIAYSFKLVL